MYSINQVAEKLGVGRDTVVKLLNEGQLGGYKIGAQWRISEEQLQTYLDSVNNRRDIEAVD
jgi:excisionase family DNA binding protein